MTEKTLEKLVSERTQEGRSIHEVIRELYNAWIDGKLVIDDPYPPKDFTEYLSRLDHSLWFWASSALIALTLIVIEISEIIPVFMFLRYVLGSVFVLFLPGMALIEALYPVEDSLSPLERLALSIGLSLAIVPLIGLMLNYTPWGIRFMPILVSLTVFSATFLLVAAYRKFSVLRK